MVCKHHNSLGFARRRDSIRYEWGFFRAWRNPRRKLLRRLFFAFPGGWPGCALLLLRLVLGLVFLTEGRFYLEGQNVTAGVWLFGLSILVAGGVLLVGFLTPIVAGIVAAGTLGVGLGILPGSTPTLFDSKIPFIFGLTMLVTLVGLGPGAFSMDARVFGRREIIIPPRASQSQDSV